MDSRLREDPLLSLPSIIRNPSNPIFSETKKNISNENTIEVLEKIQESLQKQKESTFNQLPPKAMAYYHHLISGGKGPLTPILVKDRLDSLYYTSLKKTKYTFYQERMVLEIQLIRHLIEKDFSKKTLDYLMKYYSVYVGSSNDDFIQGEYDIIIEPGGNDHYLLSSLSKGPGFTLILDKRGNDHYIQNQESSPFQDIMIIDYQGNDHYLGNSPLSVAGAFFNNQLLLDLAGDDIYQAVSHAVCFSFCGMALLYDKKGNDIYHSGPFSQCAALPNGYSILLDMEGDDIYQSSSDRRDIRDPSQTDTYGQCFTMGIRPFREGGFSLLYEKEGNDIFNGGYFCQGSAYWGGSSILINRHGNDIYHSARYAQGSASHFAAAGLFDFSGDDSYHSTGVSMGCGHDIAIGILNDNEGKDIFNAQWLSLGASSANGIGILLAPSESARFYAEDSSCFAHADTSRGTRGFSLFIKNKKAPLNQKKINPFREEGYLIEIP